MSGRKGERKIYLLNRNLKLFFFFAIYFSFHITKKNKISKFELQILMLDSNEAVINYLALMSKNVNALKIAKIIKKKSHFIPIFYYIFQYRIIVL